MNTNDQNRLIPLELTLDDLTWLHAFLKEESLAAEIDHEKVERLHTDVAIRAAKAVLSKEHDRMTKIADAIDATLKAIDEHEARARKIAATLPAQPPVA